MKNTPRLLAVVLSLAVLPAWAQTPPQAPPPAAPAEEPYHLNATLVEGCSCHSFCPCYLSAARPENEYCNFNIAMLVKKGNYGTTSFDGMKIWLSGNLGAQFASGNATAVVISVDPKIGQGDVTQEQMDAAAKVLAKVYPVKWGSAVVEKTPMLVFKDKDKIVAKLGDGTNGMLELSPMSAQGNDGKNPPIITNLRYFGASTNKGFILYTASHHYKGHDLDYKYEGRNGFVIEIEAGSAKPSGTPQ